MVSSLVHIVGDSRVRITIHDLVNKKFHDYWYGADSQIQPLNVKKQIVLSFDPSKSNTGLIVGDLSGTILYLIQISGAGSQTSIEAFCMLLRMFLAALFEDSDIAMFAQEKPILPRTGYRSMLYLNEIRTNLNNTAREVFGVDPIEVPVSVWKSAILPQQYRHKGKPKGSWQWLTQMYPEWSFLKDDVTDAICIYLYLYKTDLGKRAIYCDASEICANKESLIIDESAVVQGAMTRFKYNSRFSLEENASYFANRRLGLGYALIPEGVVTIPALYEHGCNLTRNSDPQRLFLLVRKG